ncbi:MAG TPA: twin-arginine translocase subunit TatC [Candidatus Thermoplasmatota archaeon]|nr:twin-arginine translocase subunit TatC [Candidatus Thermoplasmatota archaeon]
MAVLRLALALALLLAPSGLAATAEVRLAEEGGRWNVVSAAVDPGAGEVLVWMPRDARVQSVSAGNATALLPARWTAAGDAAVRVELPPGADRAEVAFDLRGGALAVVRLVAPRGLDALRVEARPAPDDALFADGLAFEEASPGVFVANATDVPAGAAFPLRAVPRDRVGELPVLLAVGLMALLALAAGVAWHAVRPPGGGKRPERFLDHLAELQARLAPVAIVFGVLNLFYFVAGLRRVGPWIVPTLDTGASLAARAFDAFAQRLVPPDVALVVLRPADAVLAQVQMTLFLAAVSVLPLLLYELVAFLAPGLETRERRVALRSLPLVAGLFLAGALLGYLVMAPLMIRTLYEFAPGVGAEALLGVGDLVSFALLVVVAFGLAFELPVLMHVLARLGVVGAKTFRRYFRHAVVVIFLVAGVMTPDPSVVSQLLVAVPLLVLYLIGIGAAAWGERARAAAAE